jgi:hypothetical protein
MGRVLIPIFSVLSAATVAILSEIVAHNGFGIATDAIRADALRAAAPPAGGGRSASERAGIGAASRAREGREYG